MDWLSRFIAFHRRKRKISRQYASHMGAPIDFRNPVTSQEKIQYRKLVGNHRFYASVTDKYKVREYVAQRVGERYLVPLLGVYDSLSPELLQGIPAPFIIKANHGSKWNQVVMDKGLLDAHAMASRFNGFLNQRYSRVSSETHYDFIEPRILVEQLLLDHGEAPWDYNLFCYNGSKGFDFAITISSPDLSRAAHFDRDWNLWESNFSPEQTERYVKPRNFGEMVDVARALSADFDFVRVDLYNIDGRIYFGELTCTPASGLKPIENAFRNRMRGEMWELAKDNPLLYQPLGWTAD